MPVVPWVKKMTENLKNTDQRKQNSKQENDLLDLAQERWDIARERQVVFTGLSLHQKWREYVQIYRGK